MHDYTLEVLSIIAFGFFIKIGADETLTAINSAILSSYAFGFNRFVMATFANSLLGMIFYRRLPQLLVGGSDLDANDISPVVSKSPNHKGATEHLFSLDAIMADEVDRGWMSGGSERP